MSETTQFTVGELFKKVYMNEKEVSLITGIKIPTLRNWRHLGKGIAFLKLPDSRAVRYIYSDVRDFMEKNRISFD